MSRVLIFLLASVIFYFGTVFLIEFRNPGVKDLSAEVPDYDPEVVEEATSLPKVVLGHFSIDKTGSQNWLLGQTQLSSKTTETFSDRHAQQAEFGFNGKDIWFKGQNNVHPVKILEVTEKLVSFRVLDLQNPYTAFLQWDSKGGVWYSDYTTKQDGKQQLYRARYRRSER